MSSVHSGKDDVHKSGQPGSSVNGGGYRPPKIPGDNPNPLVTVQPPRREDLQPSYAQTLVGESDQGNHGWYGSMSKSESRPPSMQCVFLQCAATNIQTSILSSEPKFYI